MKYEFHVGDYVETKDGGIGVITKVNGINTDSSSCWCCTSSRGSRIEEHSYVIPVGTDADMARIFNRIGQYDFTKKDEGKIEPLVKSWILESDNSKGEYHFDSCEVIKKINELVEAVNQLKEKIDGN